MARSSVGLSLYEKLNLAWRIIRSKPDNLVQHAQRELKLVDEHRNRSSVKPETELDRRWAAEMTKNVLEVITVFSTQGHSGFSAGYALNLLKSLLAFKPLTPLTGEDVEWVEAGEGVWQNNRCSTVFKDGAGKAWNIDGRVFIEPTGEGYTNVKSRVFVTFPCTPVTVYAREGNLEDAFPTFAEVLKAYAEAEPKKIITPQHH